MQHTIISNIVFISLAPVIPGYAMAYIGPGAGVTAIGTVIALIGAIVLALVGFVWYPLKRFMSKKKAKQSADKESP